MAKLTRRGFIRRTSIGAATIGALAAAPGLAAAQASPRARISDLSTAELHEPLVAHVRNAALGEIALLVGTREVIVRDPELVVRLVKAAR
jgi:hypothetical protein